MDPRWREGSTHTSGSRRDTRPQELIRGFSDDTGASGARGGLRREGQKPAAVHILSLSAHGEEKESHKTPLRKNVFKDSDTKMQAATQYNGMG